LLNSIAALVPAVLDLTISIELGIHISLAAKRNSIVDFKFSRDYQLTSPWTFQAHPSYLEEAEALNSVLTHFGWSSYTMLSSADELSRSVSMNLAGINKPLLRLYIADSDTYLHIQS
jgi:hypothetical protein